MLNAAEDTVSCRIHSLQADFAREVDSLSTVAYSTKFPRNSAWEKMRVSFVRSISLQWAVFRLQPKYKCTSQVACSVTNGASADRDRSPKPPHVLIFADVCITWTVSKNDSMTQENAELEPVPFFKAHRLTRLQKAKLQIGKTRSLSRASCLSLATDFNSVCRRHSFPANGENRYVPFSTTPFFKIKLAYNADSLVATIA